jgi:hypothetical protein
MQRQLEAVAIAAEISALTLLSIAAGHPPGENPLADARALLALLKERRR